ncbi:hypothetical protein CNMCM8980_009625 [Aspergillus fumigatiaffinis]|jgi:hypothetical protein|uniref:Increased loss of mitochondrial DNA protein 1 n=1 Tax=Aspergillus fumigatiaffinis TaxID=340414 RepID=A0A8H4HGN3_9EURO|nr:hypothetical protein CNMCM6457_005236 [Aspergillus fumigatiaffinis]KAF4243304.1 hypothetical protein CNMCM6805_001313 [Aspergillus fumigatiaffinis]KAF4250986.1 hypothetical protein CNMCM8980_009625 [Aspergillus fumigatiaffinis]
MALLSSKTLIQAHALFLFVLAVYLTRSPSTVTESDVVFMIGEVLQIDAAPSFSRPQSPFALCGILLIADALVDLIIVAKIPRVNELVAMAQAARSQSATPMFSALQNPFAARLAALYSEIWTLLSAARFCLFFAVSFFIYQSKPDAWGMGAGAARSTGGYGALEATSGLDQLKNRVVFTYGFMEMMFWLWIFITLREERQEIAARFVEREE